MKRITIERYPAATAEDCGYAGLVEGETDDGRRWIMWLGLDGTPEIFFGDREEDGTVLGEDIHLVPDSAGLVGKHAELFDKIIEEVGDGEPTEDQYLQIRRISYTDRTIWFADDQPTRESPHHVCVYNRRNHKIKATGEDSGRAYWRYRQLLARIQQQPGTPSCIGGLPGQTRLRSAVSNVEVDPGLGEGADHAALAGSFADAGEWISVDATNLGDEPEGSQV